MTSSISRWILKMWGWEVVKDLEAFPPKSVVAVVPHTSWWDFPLGVLVRSSIQMDIKYVAKKSIFKPPFGWFFRATGGYPVDRSKRGNFVQSVIDIFDSKEKFSICIAPEGTRKKVDRLKTGYYYIAKGANIPIILCQFDWGNRKVVFSEPFYPTEDKEADFEYIWNYFKGVKGYNPEWGIL